MNCKSYVYTDPPGDITNITIEQGDTWVMLTWQPPSNQGVPPISNYQICAEATNSSQDIQTDDVFFLNSTTTTFTITELLPMTMYTVSLMTLTNLTGSVETGTVTLVNATTQPPTGK